LAAVSNERPAVAVYAVGNGGVTGRHLGWATLVEPGVGLAHPPVNERPTGDDTALRVGIGWSGPPRVEVIDVAAAHVLPDAPDLVVLELSRDSAAPTTPAPIAIPEDPLDPFAFLAPSREQVIAGLRTLLAETSGSPPGDAPTPVDDPIRIVLRALGLHP